ncbi:MAG: glycine--tRNA ligase subunit beta, partial [candidate division WOR-3 bacterium]
MNVKNLLLEIGTEELPASFPKPAAEVLKEKVSDFLKQNRISFGKAKIFYTPRRIAVIWQKVSEKQRKEIIEVAGPP